jgi:hypothetical protein
MTLRIELNSSLAARLSVKVGLSKTLNNQPSFKHKVLLKFGFGSGLIN